MHSAQFRLNSELELSHWWFVARRRILRQLIRQVLPADRSILLIDVGCGTGANAACLNEEYCCVGIDPCQEAIELARQRFPGTRFVCGRAPEDLGEEFRRARLVLMTDVLEHIEDDFMMFTSLLAAASPGTYFLLTVPANPALWSPHDESHGHWRRYDRRRLERLWEGVPVRPLLVSYFNARLYPVIRVVRLLNRWRGKPSGAARTDFRMPPAWLNRALDRIFAGEARRLTGVLEKRRRRGYPFGVSLVALVQREPGQIAVG